MRLVIFYDMLLDPSFKTTKRFVNVVRTTTSARQLIFKKYFKSSAIGSLYEKQFFILSQLKTSLMLKLAL